MSKSKKIILIISLLFCTIIQILPVIRTGLIYSYGMGFWGANGHDGIWHLSLINNISNPLKIDMPTFSGQFLSNYHPFFNILISVVSKISNLPSHFILFQIFPIVSAFIYLYLSFLIGKKITNKFLGGIFLIFINTFSNSFGFIISLFRHGNLNGESVFWAMQSASNQINPPFILSSIFFLYILYTLIKSEKISKIDTFFIIIFASLSPITKAYSAVPIFGILGFFALQELIKKNYQHLIIFIVSLIFSVSLFSVFNKNSSSLLVYEPFWFVNSMMESPDRLYLPRLSSLKYTLESLQKFNIKLLFINIVAISIFLIGNFGFRTFSLFTFFKKRKLYIYYLLFISLILTLIPTLFIQKGTSWNTIQFLYYALLIFNIFLAIFLSERKKILFPIILLVIMFITNISNYQSYLGNPSPTSIKKEELEALNFLKNQAKGNILTYPYDAYLKLSYKQTPIPIHAYETTSYVAAFSQKQTFVDDYMNLSNSGFDYESRLKESKKFFEQKDKNFDRGFLVNNQIDYIYLVNEQISQSKLDEKNLYIKNIFDNNWVRIYKVQR